MRAAASELAAAAAAAAATAAAVKAASVVVFPVAMLLLGLVEARRLPCGSRASGRGGGRELGVPRDVEEVVEATGDGASRLILLGDGEGLLLLNMLLLVVTELLLGALCCL